MTKMLNLDFALAIGCSRLIGPFVLVLSFFGPFALAERITNVQISGNKRIELGAIQAKMSSKIGTNFSKENIAEDIRSIYSLGAFENVQVYQEKSAGGVTLVVELKEKPIVAFIDYKGLAEFDKDDLKDVISIKIGDVLNREKLGQSIDKLRAKYEDKGFFLANVTAEEVPDKTKNQITLVFNVEENDKIEVREIRIVGASAVQADDLKKVMQTKEGGAFSFLTGGGSYREATFERDIQMLSYYYGTLGYVRAKISKPEISISPDKQGIYITFFIEEGPQYSYGNFTFKGDLLFTEEELQNELKLIPGEIVNMETVRQEMLRYTEKYGDLGFAYANVNPRFNYRDDEKRLDIQFDVDRGDRVFIGKIIVTSNTKTKDKVLRRELKIHEGELFNGTKKRESRDNVMRLGFFETVEFYQTSSKTYPNVVDIEIRVKERSTGQLVIGAGYASGPVGFTAQAQLSQNNFLGNGQSASLSAQILTGSRHYEFSLGFTEPYVGSSLWSLGGEIYQLKRNLFSISSVSTFQETKTGFNIRLGHPVFEFTNFFLQYKLEGSWVPESSIIDRALIPKDSVNGLSSGLTASIVFDKRNDRLDPRSGWYWTLSEEVVGLGGSRKYFRTRSNLKFFQPIWGDLIFRFNVAGGNITSFGGENVPINELFVQGGLSSLRGYEVWSVGPKSRLSTNPLNLSADAIAAGAGGREIVLGGRNEVLMNAELQFPILKDAGLRGVVFIDVGNAFNGGLFAQDPLVYANWGYGIRWITPVGPLRFEFGYPMVGGSSPKFNFTIGPPF